MRSYRNLLTSEELRKIAQVPAVSCDPFEAAIGALASGRVRPELLIDDVLAFSRATEHAVLKVLLDMRAQT
jgi:hypothetical protein